MFKIDGIGRFTIPKKLRETYNMNEGDTVQVIDSGEGIIVKPLNMPYRISNKNMDELRKAYLMLKESGFLDDLHVEIFSTALKEADVKCEKCGTNMFLTSDNTFKCYKCD